MRWKTGTAVRASFAFLLLVSRLVRRGFFFGLFFLGFRRGIPGAFLLDQLFPRLRGGKCAGKPARPCGRALRFFSWLAGLSAAAFSSGFSSSASGGGSPGRFSLTSCSRASAAANALENRHGRAGELCVSSPG